MDDSFLEAFCYYFALDYENFRFLFHKWFTVRGITRHFTINFPQSSRIYISVPLLKNEKILVRSFSTDTEFSRSSLNEVDVHYEGSLASESISSSDGNESPVMFPRNEISKATPDIVRTIRRNKRNNELTRSDSDKSLGDSEIDPGFQSDASGSNRNTSRKLEELQEQFAKMQKDIAGLVQLHSLREIGSLFAPIMSSSPSAKPHSVAPEAPPPPCVPPPPPAPPSPFSMARSSRGAVNDRSQQRRSAREGLPDMSELLKGISAVRLRPVRQNGNGNGTAARPSDDSKDFSFVPLRVPLRSVTRHESIVAVALRERFQQFRMLPNDSNDSSAAEISDDWSDDPDNKSVAMTTALTNRSLCNIGRALLRKVDRSKLPEKVSKDFSDCPARIDQITD